MSSQLNRALSDEERALLVYILASGSPSAQSFSGQVEFARVVDNCKCGCPTIHLQIDRAAKAGTADNRIIVDLVGKIPDGRDVGVLVFVEDGYLSSLEVYIFENNEGPFPLPVLTSLHEFADTNRKPD